MQKEETHYIPRIQRSMVISPHDKPVCPKENWARHNPCNTRVISFDVGCTELQETGERGMMALG